MSSASSSSEQSVDRGRINFWVQHIGRLLNRSVKKMSADDVQLINSATARLLVLIQQADKPSKDAFLKQPLAIDTLITVLQVIACENTVGNIINIFNEIVGKVHPAKRASILVNHGLTTVLFQIMKLAHTNDICLSDDVLIAIHVLLSRIGHKDCKFAVKARLHQSLMLTLNLVKTHFHNFRNLQPLLQVLKMYTNNSVNASYLGKHNSVNVMLNIIFSCGKRHTVDLKLALENLCNLTKSKSNSARLIDLNGVPQLLACHSEWQHLDTKHKHLTIRRCILQVLKNVTDLKAGRLAFVEADGIRILYEGALEASDCRDMESLILLASIILRKCCPRNKLPLESCLSPVTFSLPISATHTPECYLLSDFPGHMTPRDLSNESSSSVDIALTDKFNHLSGVFQSLVYVPQEQDQNTAAGVESDHSSLDEIDENDIDSDDEKFRIDTEEADEDHLESPDPAETRTLEDLRMYDNFFPELLEQQFQSTLPAPPVCAPLRRSLSVNLNTWSNVLSGELSPMRHVSSDAALKKMCVDNSSPCSFQKQHSVSLSNQVTSTEISNQFEDRSASAVNLKTGSAVITLDLGPFRSPAHSRSSITVLRGKKKKKSVATRERFTNSRSSAACLDKLACDSFSNMNFPMQETDDNNQIRYASNEELDSECCFFAHDHLLYAKLAVNTHSVYKFQKLAFPDMYGVKGSSILMEALSFRKFGVQRAKIFEDIERMIHPETLLDAVVYDLDQLILDTGNSNSLDRMTLTNTDESRIGHISSDCGDLKFNAQFECGNLRKVIHVRQYEYDLILNPDINANHHHQWFYFEVSNMLADKPYRFNIVNCEKLNSQFNFGMQPLMMSVTEAAQGNAFWQRVGSDICYYKNHFIRNTSTTGGVQGKTYFTATFSVTFPHSADVCYISYHYPYSYTALQTHLKQWEQQYDRSAIFFRNQSLCTTLGGNSVPVLTITAQPRSVDTEGLEELRSRPYIFLSGRVHPGESNASWVMKGTIDFLLSKKPQAQQVRERYIFKIVPMLNPDGVVNGNHRSSLVGEDLNRRWGRPCKILHPTIYHTKGLLQYLHMINKTPMVYCDYHGHSRRKNIFLYGCSPNQTWIANDTQNPACCGSRPTDFSYKQLPRLLDANCPSFCLKNCSFMVEKCKENTARVVVWRHIGVVRSYTMESSYCGCDQGKYKDIQMNTTMLEEMGHKFCETLLKLATQKGGYDQQRPVFDPDLATATEPTPDDIEDDLEDKLNLRVKKKGSHADSLLDDSDSFDEDEEDDEEEFDDDVEND
ncbi:unnamed protein product [Candidula unifasciata]|uniref:tubulin-glutamate carboxypeptidase n=1 Tax=Candidula unifasciata TaxID=100452 RepID=A0A8S3ZH98_9EUPU|nr:unnamed protein product [Candidula unifasciata]